MALPLVAGSVYRTEDSDSWRILVLHQPEKHRYQIPGPQASAPKDFLRARTFRPSCLQGEQ
jgi:hypothetical protein